MEKQCPRCGAPLVETARYCHQCGARTEGPQEEGFPRPSPLSDPLASALCYLLGIVTGVLLLNMEPYRANPRVRFHAWQSIFFSIAWFTIVSIHSVVSFGFFYLWFLAPFVNLAFTILWVLLMVKAYNGEKFELPVLGDLAHRQSV